MLVRAVQRLITEYSEERVEVQRLNTEYSEERVEEERLNTGGKMLFRASKYTHTYNIMLLK